jgi:hypothetical protein
MATSECNQQADLAASVFSVPRPRFSKLVRTLLLLRLPGQSQAEEERHNVCFVAHLGEALAAPRVSVAFLPGTSVIVPALP